MIFNEWVNILMKGLKIQSFSFSPTICELKGSLHWGHTLAITAQTLASVFSCLGNLKQCIEIVVYML